MKPLASAEDKSIIIDETRQCSEHHRASKQHACGEAQCLMPTLLYSLNIKQSSFQAFSLSRASLCIKPHKRIRRE